MNFPVEMRHIHQLIKDKRLDEAIIALRQILKDSPAAKELYPLLSRLYEVSNENKILLDSQQFNNKLLQIKGLSQNLWVKK
ncbi:MAG: hypothetical protein DRP78_06180 [Candidatus Omnitrophota bacterium]|nr:MAG: hypothetical protein DRP78_06180 [Candidatus Omnitrophota bacterium]